MPVAERHNPFHRQASPRQLSSHGQIVFYLGIAIASDELADSSEVFYCAKTEREVIRTAETCQQYFLTYSID
jgi:hypothetical protein